MLGDKDRMSSPGSLLPIIQWFRRRKAFVDEVTGVSGYCFQSSAAQVLCIFSAELLPAAKLRTL